MYIYNLPGLETVTISRDLEAEEGGGAVLFLCVNTSLDFYFILKTKNIQTHVAPGVRFLHAGREGNSVVKIHESKRRLFKGYPAIFPAVKRYACLLNSITIKCLIGKIGLMTITLWILKCRVYFLYISTLHTLDFWIILFLDFTISYFPHFWTFGFLYFHFWVAFSENFLICAREKEIKFYGTLL